MKHFRSVALFALVFATALAAGCSSSTGGSIDASRLSAPCTSGSCSNGGLCTNFSAVDSTYDLPFCVNTQNACEAVSCNKGSCTLTRGNPSFVHCGE